MNLNSLLAIYYRDNFVAYYRAHAAHINVTGRNFYSDHRLLGKIYEDLQAEIDHIGELIRTRGEVVDSYLGAIVADAGIDDAPMIGTALDMLQSVHDDLTELVMRLQQIIDVATQEAADDVADYAQGRMLEVKRWRWQLASTLE